MNIYQFLSFAGPAIGILSFAYAIYTRKKSKLEKNLVYEVMPPVAIAEITKGQSAYSLKVVYERPGEDPVYIRHAFVQYIRFTNFGRIPIKKNDLAKADPLRVEATTGGRVLDISLASVTSDVCQITIGQPKQENGHTLAILDFDFLDYLDGGLIQILSDTDEVQASLHGTVIGMPNGIRKEKDISGPRSLPTWGCIIAIVIELIALAAVPLTYRFVTGSWKLVWLLGLPVAALIVLPLFFLLVLSILEPGVRFRFPEQLLPPDWYGLRRELSYRLPEARYKTRETETLSYKEEPQAVFHDTFERFAGWEQYLLGNVSLSTDIPPHTGTSSMKKDSNNDPNGGFKEIGKSIGLGFVFSGSIYSPAERAGGQSDRLAIEDTDFNGYGFSVSHDSNTVSIERRDKGEARVSLSKVSFDPPTDQWYQFKLYVKAGGRLELRLCDSAGKELLNLPSVSDEKYSSFNRVAVHGGFPYYVDELKIQTL